MFKPFSFARTPNLVFGKYSLKKLDQITASLGKKVLLIYHPSFEEMEIGKKTLAELDDIEVEIIKFVTEEEASPEVIDACRKEHKAAGIDGVVAIGDDNILNIGKALSAMLSLPEENEFSVEDYIDGVGLKKHPGTKIPFICVPSSFCGGLMSSSYAIITKRGKFGFTKAFNHDNFVPDHVIIDTDLFEEDMENARLFALNILAQLLESFVSPHSNVMTDRFALTGFQYLKPLLSRPLDTVTPQEIKSNLAYVSYIAGMCQSNAGWGTTFCLTTAVDSVMETDRVKVNTTFFANTHSATIERLRKGELGHKVTLAKYGQIAKIFVDNPKLTGDYLVNSLIDKLENFTDECGVPRLSEYGIGEEHIDQIAKRTSNRYNPADLSRKELAAIIKSRI